MSILAAAPALPLHKAGPYVAAAYIVFVAILLIYLGIMAVRLTRTHRELARLKREMEAREAHERELEHAA
jgi:HAMP domain-containing protein